MKRYQCNGAYVLTAGQGAQGYGVNCMAASPAEAKQEVLDALAKVFPAAVAVWVDNITVISDTVN